jgi:hypothetical protein
MAPGELLVGLEGLRVHVDMGRNPAHFVEECVVQWVALVCTYEHDERAAEIASRLLEGRDEPQVVDAILRVDAPGMGDLVEGSRQGTVGLGAEGELGKLLETVCSIAHDRSGIRELLYGEGPVAGFEQGSSVQDKTAALRGRESLDPFGTCERGVEAACTVGGAPWRTLPVVEVVERGRGFS